MIKFNVENMVSSEGTKVVNQFIINTGNKKYFQSYKTMIACKSDKGIYIDTNALHYSRTTSKYLYMFLNMDRKEIEAGIKDGSIKVGNLN